MRTLATMALGLLFLAPQLASQVHTPVGVKRPAVVERWGKQLKENEKALQAGEWKKAKRATDDLLDEMCSRIEGGQGVEWLLGSAAFLRSLAEAGLGNEAAANWDFNTALTMRPELSEVDLSQYGAAGKMLEPWQVPSPVTEVAGLEVGSEETLKGEDSPPRTDLEPPKKIRAPRPKYPFAKLKACADGPIIIRVVLDKEGFPRDPRLLSVQDPILGFAALEAFRNWRFRPARLDGEPVPVYYNLTVNFIVPNCTNFFARSKLAKEKG